MVTRALQKDTQAFKDDEDPTLTYAAVEVAKELSKRKCWENEEMKEDDDRVRIMRKLRCSWYFFPPPGALPVNVQDEECP